MEKTDQSLLRDRHSAPAPETDLDQLSQIQSEMRLLLQQTGCTQLDLCLRQIPNVCRSEWLPELILHDIQLRRAAGQVVILDDYRQRFPDNDDWLRLAMQLLEPGLADGGSAMSGDGPVLESANLRSGGRDLDLQQQVGRYRIERLLGQGGFGRVYLATDMTSGLGVALKIPRPDTWRGGWNAEVILREAARAARMCRDEPVPGVVRILETFEHDGLPVIVMDYVEGGDLSRRLLECGGRLELDECVGLLRRLCVILQRIHESHLIHRDLKPRNVLLDRDGNPWLTDFGIACLESERLSLGNPSAGTLKYMAPEQINEETTRLGPHTDVWSFGVMMYEMLSGQLPFQGRGAELKQLILAGEPWSLRSRDGAIPELLAEICHKCLRNSLQERYRDMVAVAADLDVWIREVRDQQVRGNRNSLLPRLRGLQSYNEQDRDTFPALLPGELEPDGLPSSLHYWLMRLEVTPVRRNSGGAVIRAGKTEAKPQRGSEQFSVGVIHGGSGCGKTSFVKAGLLPLLPESIHRIYLEATPQETELELLRVLRQRYPEVGAEGSGPSELPQVFRQLREGVGLPPGGRLLIVLDQFEQWLHAHVSEKMSELAMALRHCEAGRLQVLLLVREEYWSAIQEFFRQLDIRLDTHWNDQCLPWFGKNHSIRVLTCFGQALGKLPLDVSCCSPGQQAFLENAVTALGNRQGGKVVPVQLAMFAELFREPDWTATDLERQGGTEGVGTQFLMQIFSAGDAREEDRRHREAAMRLLEELLPGEGQDIRGHRRPESELRQVCGYADDPLKYRQLMDLLESRLKLIARRDPILETGYVAVEPCYMLTHDFLVPSIRAWVAVELGRTAAGRAQSLLRLRQKTYAERREHRQLPGFLEWIRIWTLTNHRFWTDSQRRMMSVAARTHLLRFGILGILLLVSVTVVLRWGAYRDAQYTKEKLLRAGAEELVEIFPELDNQQDEVGPLLQAVVERAEREPRKAGAADSVWKPQLHARLGLMGWEESQVDWLLEQLLEQSDLEYVDPIRVRLRRYAPAVAPRLIGLLKDVRESAAIRFRAALGLVGLPRDSWEAELTSAELELIALEMTNVFAERQPLLRGLLQPIGAALIPPLVKLFDAETASPDQQVNAATALLEFARKDRRLLSQLVTRSTIRQVAILFPAIADDRSALVRNELLTVLEQQPGENATQRQRVELGRRRANAAISLLRQGDRHDFLKVFRVSDDPEALSQFVARCAKCGVTATDLLVCLESACQLRRTETDSANRNSAHRLYGLMMALGNYSLDALPADRRQVALTMLQERYVEDPSAEVHSASGWLLRHWGQAALVKTLDQQEVAWDPTGKRDWFRIRLELRPRLPDTADVERPKQVHFLTFVVFPAGTYQIGAPTFEGAEEDRQRTEVPRAVTISRPVAICDRELTYALFDLYDGGAWRNIIVAEWPWGRDVTGDSPVSSAHWIQWIDFCRWLTAECYGPDEAWQSHEELPTVTDSTGSTYLAADSDLRLDRAGFRMPTESEWELATRGGQRTAYAFGGDVELLADYGWFMENSGKRPHTTAEKRPTISGLFDTHGNLYEWTFDRKRDRPPAQMLDDVGPDIGEKRVLRGGSWSYPADRCRSAYRDDDDPYSSGLSFGIRLALTPSALPVANPDP